MSNNLTIQGTVHLRAILNSAVESPQGVVITGLSKSRAIHLRGMLHSLRAQDRRASEKIYTQDEPGYGKSAYDVLITEIIREESTYGDNCTLRILRSDHAADDLTIIDAKDGTPIDLEDFK